MGVVEDYWLAMCRQATQTATLTVSPGRMLHLSGEAGGFAPKAPRPVGYSQPITRFAEVGAAVGVPSSTTLSGICPTPSARSITRLFPFSATSC